MEIKNWILKHNGIVLILIALILIIFTSNKQPTVTQNQSTPTISTEEKNKQEEQAKNPTNIISFNGNQAGKSKEFIITSNEAKFVYQCDDGLFVCVAWLYQVGGAKQQLFHSSGSSGNFSEQKTLSIGPGTFYIEMDTSDRAYKIDVFQSSIPANSNETTSAQTKVDDSKKYRNVSGFKLTDENMISGMLRYIYETNDGKYSVDLQVYSDKTNSKLEDEFSLAAGNLNINTISIQYAFDKGATINGVQTIKPYDSAEFIFIAGDKTHFGFVRKINKDSKKEGDRIGIETALKSFINALVPNILSDKYK